MAFNERATAWSVTINNPTAEDEEEIATAKQKSGWTVSGQLEECPTTGTPHYQLMLKTPQIRGAAIKKHFKRAHIEIARNVKALEQYVVKEESRIGALPTTDKYPTLNQFWDLVFEFHQSHLVKQMEYQGLETDEDRLVILDQSVNHLICQGYFVESIGVNPQTRSSAKKYLKAIFIRCEKHQRQRQTDRQKSDLNNVEVNIQNEGPTQNSVRNQESEDEESQSYQSSESDWSE